MGRLFSTACVWALVCAQHC